MNIRLGYVSRSRRRIMEGGFVAFRRAARIMAFGIRQKFISGRMARGHTQRFIMTAPSRSIQSIVRHNLCQGIMFILGRERVLRTMNIEWMMLGLESMLLQSQHIRWALSRHKLEYLVDLFWFFGRDCSLNTQLSFTEFNSLCSGNHFHV